MTKDTSKTRIVRRHVDKERAIVTEVSKLSRMEKGDGLLGSGQCSQKVGLFPWYYNSKTDDLQPFRPCSIQLEILNSSV